MAEHFVTSPAERRRYDLVVAGGGMSGLCAAVMAARQQLRVALVQDRPVLGGCGSSEVRIHIHGAGTYWPWMVETGPLAEMVDEERFRNPEPVFEGSINAIWDLVLYEWATREPTLELLLNTSVRGVATADGPAGRTVSAVQCSQQGSEKEFALEAPLFVDATGDGTLAALGGARWRMGREGRDEFNERKAPPRPDEITQGSTIQFRTRDLGRPAPFVAPDWAEKYPDDESLYSRVHRPPLGGYWWIEIGHPFDTLADNETIRHELLRHVLGVFDHIKNHGDHGAENLTLDWVGPIPGKRETRRIVGPTMITENDLRRRRSWPDRVCHGGWFLDEHVPGGLLARGKKPEESAYDFDRKDLQMVGPYGLPLSCLIAGDLPNVMLAGRDLSASHMALMSARVIGTCAATGQAVGAAAAVCIQRGKRPDELSADDVAAVQQLLLREDHYVPFVRNADPADLARAARVSASSSGELRLDATGPQRWLALDFAVAQLLPLTAGRLERVACDLDNTSDSPVELRATLHRLDDLWSINHAIDAPDGLGTVLAPTIQPDRLDATAVASATATLPPGKGQGEFTFDVAIEPGLYAVVLSAVEGVAWGSHLSPPPGTAVAKFRKSGLWRFEGLRGNWPALSMRVWPASRPFEPDNVINGVARPEVMPNLWCSGPDQPLPQTLTLELAAPAELAEVRIAFDSNLGRNIRGTPGNYVAPELVRDYRVEARVDGQWRAVAEVRDNRRRHRVHRFEPVRADAVRLVIAATHGLAEARVYEVRVYGR